MIQGPFATPKWEAESAKTTTLRILSLRRIHYDYSASLPNLSDDFCDIGGSSALQSAVSLKVESILYSLHFLDANQVSHRSICKGLRFPCIDG